MALKRQLRAGAVAMNIEGQCRSAIAADNCRAKTLHECHSQQEVKISHAESCDDYPPFPECYCPKSPPLLEAFLAGYCLHKEDLLRELRSHVSSCGIAIDHKQGDMKRVKINATNESAAGTQTFTLVGNCEIVLNPRAQLFMGQLSRAVCKDSEEDTALLQDVQKQFNLNLIQKEKRWTANISCSTISSSPLKLVHECCC